MGILNKFVKGLFDFSEKLEDKIENLAGKLENQVESAVDKLGNLLDSEEDKISGFVLKKRTTVSSLKEQFNNRFGSVLRVYSGRSQADDKDTLGDVGLTKEGTFDCRGNLHVDTFIARMADEWGLKVKVYTCDDWVAVLDDMTLSASGQVKKNATKADMEMMLSGTLGTSEISGSLPSSATDVAADEDFDDADEVEDIDELEDPIAEYEYDNVSYDIYSDCAMAQFLVEDGKTTRLVIPDAITYEGKKYPVTYWGAGDEGVKVVELGKNITCVDALHAGCYSLQQIIFKDPKKIVEWTNEDGDEVSCAEECFPGVEIIYETK